MYAQAYESYGTNLSKSGELAEKALQYALTSEDAEAIARCQFFLGGVYYQQKIFGKAYKMYSQAKKGFGALENELYTLQSEWALAILFTEIGSPAQAELRLSRIQTDLLAHLDSSRYAVFLSDFAKARAETGALSASLSVYETALGYTDDPYQKSFIANRMGAIYFQMGQRDRAYNQYKISLAIALEQRFWVLAGRAQLNLGHLALEQDSPDSAVVWCRASQESFARGNDPSTELIALQYLAKGHEALGQQEAAKQALHKAVSLIPQSRNFATNIVVLSQLARLDPTITTLFDEIEAQAKAQEVSLQDFRNAVEQAEILEIEASFEQANQEEYTQRERQRWMIALLVVLLGSLGIILYFWKRSQKAQKLAEKHKQEAHRIRQESLDFTARWSKTTEKLKHLRP